MATTATLFAGESASAVYSSPLTRALTLAVTLSDEMDVPLHTDERLAEIGLGVWQGLYREQIRERYPDIFELWYAKPNLVHFPEGESLAEVQARASSWLAEIIAKYPEGHTVIAVTHSAVIQVLAAAALGLDLSCIHRIHIDNCSITTLTGSSPPGALLTLNDRQALSRSPVAAASGGDLLSLIERRTTH